jgi:hypothetical protein
MMIHEKFDALATGEYIAASRTDIPRLVRMLRVAMETLDHYAKHGPHGTTRNVAAYIIAKIDAIANE